MNLREGDIWFCNVYFEDKPNECKERPVMVLADTGNTFRAVKMTHHCARTNDPYDYELRYWKEAGLRTLSTARAGHLLNLPKTSTRFRIGHVLEEDLNEIYYLIAQKQRFGEKVQSFDESISHITESMTTREKLQELLKCGMCLLEAAEVCRVEYDDRDALKEAAKIALEDLPVENTIVDGKAICKEDWE